MKSKALMKLPPLWVQILIAMLVGGIVGFVLRNNPVATSFGEPGRALIQTLKALAGPLLFLAILDSILRSSLSLKDLIRMLKVMGINATLALTLGLSISFLFKPGQSLSPLVHSLSPYPQETVQLELNTVLSQFLPQSLVDPFQHNAILTLVLMAIFFGFAIRKAKQGLPAGHLESLEKSIEALFQVFQIILGWFIQLIPIAVFGILVKITAQSGLESIQGLLTYVSIGLLGLGLQILLVYHGWLIILKFPIRKFWQNSWDALANALGVSSSLATLPLTLRSLKQLKISDHSARLSACVGTNFNNDGILLYEAMAVLMIAQAYGISLTPGQIAIAVSAAIVATLGIAGVPEAGLISLTLVLTSVGLPVELLPLLLSVDWILSRARAYTNVFSDLTVAIILDHLPNQRKPVKGL